MECLPSVLTTAVILCSFISFGQNKFREITFDFTDNVNSKIVHTGDQVCAILIDGYLKGKLPGYKFAVGSEVLKRGPVPTEGFKTWKSGEKYYLGESVYSDGNFYELTNHPPNLTTKPSDSQKYWTNLLVEGAPISVRRYFPTIQDTLSKSDLLQRMIRETPEKVYSWDAAAQYYSSDVVWYEGKHYELVANEAKGQLPTDDKFYSQTNRGFLFLFNSNEINTIRISYAIDVAGNKEPQTISLVLVDNYPGSTRHILTFFFDDAINYLNTTNNTLLYTSDSGYLGVPEMVLDQSERLSVLQILKTKLIEKRIKPNKRSIIDLAKYKEFLSDTTNLENTSWQAMQSLSNELIIGESRVNEFENKAYEEFNYYTVPFLKLPIETVSKYFDKGPVQINTYQQILMNGGLHASHDSTVYDTLPMRSNSIKPPGIAKRRSFYETYRAKTDSASAKLTTQVIAVWKSVETAITNQKIKAQNPLRTFYPCNYTWTKTVIDFDDRKWSFDKKFSLNANGGDNIDIPSAPNEFEEIKVTYKRQLSDTKGHVSQFEPIEISFSFFSQKDIPRHGSYPSVFTFSWKELKTILATQTSPQIVEFVWSVEKGLLNFYGSEVAYGLIEEQ